MGDTKIQMESKSTKHQRSEFTMRVGKHEAKVRFDVFCHYSTFVTAHQWFCLCVPWSVHQTHHVLCQGSLSYGFNIQYVGLLVVMI